MAAEPKGIVRLIISAQIASPQAIGADPQESIEASPYNALNRSYMPFDIEVQRISCTQAEGEEIAKRWKHFNGDAAKAVWSGEVVL